MADTVPSAAAQAIIAAGRRLDQLGWVPATAGNLSIRIAEERIAITRSGRHKSALGPDDVMLVDAAGLALDTGARPSYETGLHCGIYRRFPTAGAVLHGHSIANTLLSRGGEATIRLEGYELLKAFPGAATHVMAVDVPVFDNDQDIARLQAEIERCWGALDTPPPGYLIRGHGVYVWGPDMPGAMLRLEALEFMLACELEQRRLRR